ncbi:amidohydrolase family protein [Halonotius sp. GCM10025705]|uniref:amidohydrolase family protein n=1 Tax=Halonotius sp. GCM10025705 TaxID=3252678 RepID=UPI0036175519
MTAPTAQESSGGAVSSAGDADIVIHDALVLTVDDEKELYEQGTVCIRDGQIVAVRESNHSDADMEADVVIDGSGKLVMPGLVNTHTHLELTPTIAGASELGEFELWGYNTPLYTRFFDGEFDYLCKAGYKLAALNFLTSGVTTVNSMDTRPSLGADVFGEAGLRGFFGSVISDLFWDIPVDEQFARTREFVEAYHGSYDGRIQATICPHDDWSCTRELWERTASVAAEYPDVLVHTHLLELEMSNTIARSNGATDSLDLLEDTGLLNDRLLAAHFRVADEQDIQRTANADAGVAHCASIFSYWNPDAGMQWTPVPDLLDAGVDVGLGIDDHYWHDSYDLLGEARQARLAANLQWGHGQFTSRELVRMLTIEGARALNIGDEIGSIEAGKRADLLVLDFSSPKFAPINNIYAHVANQATRADVETVIVDGELLMRDGDVLTMDSDAVLARVEAAMERFEADTEWSFDHDGTETPSTWSVVRNAPKRGPTRMAARYALQSIKDTLRLSP